LRPPRATTVPIDSRIKAAERISAGFISRVKA
jgi:hypothetical protein